MMIGRQEATQEKNPIQVGVSTQTRTSARHKVSMFVMVLCITTRLQWRKSGEGAAAAPLPL